MGKELFNFKNILEDHQRGGLGLPARWPSP
jgi:hypothetical protein